MSNTTSTPRPADNRPLRKRKRVWAASIALFALGAIGGTQSSQDELDAAKAAAAKPAPTVTVTATKTAEPMPGPTVTETVKAKAKPRPTVTVTKTAQAAGSDTTSSDDSGTCSIVSNAGNCYSAGQYCRNSDHGAVTTTESGARIKCVYSSNAWRWTYA